jgi:hypothetical protein
VLCDKLQSKADNCAVSQQLFLRRRQRVATMPDERCGGRRKEGVVGELFAGWRMSLASSHAPIAVRGELRKQLLAFHLASSGIWPLAGRS